MQQLKKLAEKLPPLQIPGLGKRILQTDASDEYWAATLFEEIDGKKVFVGIKVVHLSVQNFTTILLSKKFLQSNVRLKNSSFIFLGIIF